ncbi:MAG: PilT/PilU family type 4a pilus ATPase [Actinomycetes bacterium]|jgi:twitching motility protein PilT|nr:MAG: type IV pili twitching motility protein PilT [Actinomycetota bacterium]
MERDIDALLQTAVALDATDIHLKVGSPPIVRSGGELRRLADFGTLRPDDTSAYAEALFTDKARADFAAHGTADFAYGKQELGRFRITAFRQRGSVSLVLRRVQAGSRSFSDLGLPRIAEKVAGSRSGLAIVTGPSSSGKTTTVSSIIDWINTHQSRAILTIEDPIEVLHPDKNSVVVQREVGVDTPDMATAIRSALRHDVDVIMLSEITDAEAARAALSAAETGHLVITTMRTKDPAETISRFVTMFPESQQPVIRTMLANHLLAIISQLLLDGPMGRVLTTEVLTNNERFQDWVVRGGDTQALLDIIKDGGFYGMQTFDQAFVRAISDGALDVETVLPHARNTHELRAKVMSTGVAV